MSDGGNGTVQAAPQQVLEDLGLRGLVVYPWSNLAMFCDSPIGYVMWGPQQIHVWNATPAQVAEARVLCGGNSPLSKEWTVLESGTEEQKARIAFWALGGEGRSPYTLAQLEHAPYGFQLVIQTAIVAFLWAGPASNSGERMPAKAVEQVPALTT